MPLGAFFQIFGLVQTLGDIVDWALASLVPCCDHICERSYFNAFFFSAITDGYPCLLAPYIGTATCGNVSSGYTRTAKAQGLFARNRSLTFAARLQNYRIL